MIEPNYDKILQGKINYYGETKAAYEFAAYEYNKQYLELNKLSIQLVSQQRELLKAFLKWRLDKPHSDFQTQDYDIKEFLKAFNCA